MSGRVLVRRRRVFLAWYPLRRNAKRRGWSGWFERVDDMFDPERNGWSLGLGFGRLLLTLGPGTPRP